MLTRALGETRTALVISEECLTRLKESFPGLRPDRILSLQLDQCIGGEVKRLSLVVSKHVELLEEFADKFWDYFSAL